MFEIKLTIGFDSGAQGVLEKLAAAIGGTSVAGGGKGKRAAPEVKPDLTGVPVGPVFVPAAPSATGTGQAPAVPTVPATTAAPTPAPAPAVQAIQPAVVSAPAPAPAPAQPDPIGTELQKAAPVGAVATIEDVRHFARTVVEKLGRDSAVKLLGKYGAQSVSGLSADYFAGFVADAKVALGQ